MQHTNCLQASVVSFCLTFFRQKNQTNFHLGIFLQNSTCRFESFPCLLFIKIGNQKLDCGPKILISRIFQN